MIDEKEVRDIIQDHNQWVSDRDESWQGIRDAFEDRFWESKSSTSFHRYVTEDAYPIRTQVNRVRPWVQAHGDAIFYRGINPSIEPDPLVRDDLDDDVYKSVETLLRAWIMRQNLNQITDAAYQMGLMYNAFAFKLGIDSDVKHPVDAAWIEVVPPWECVWDRNDRAGRRPRYLGHMFEEKRATIAKDYEKDLKKRDIDIQLFAGNKMPDELGRTQIKSGKAEGAYLKILELYDLTTSHKHETDSGDMKTPGQKRVYIIDSQAKQKESTGPILIYEGPIPFTDAAGRAAAPIVPGLLSTLPDKPMEGVAEAQTIYDLEAEQNACMTFLANAMRRDASRTILYNADKAGKAAREITKGKDLMLVGVEGSTEGVFTPLEVPAMSDTLFKYYTHLDNARRETAELSPNDQGEPMRYVTATETTRLAEHSETTLGHLRLRMDQTLSTALGIALRVISRAMRNSGSFKVRVGEEEAEITRKMLDAHWMITVSEAAATPMAEAQRRAEANEILPKLTELLTIIEAEESSALTKAAMKQMYSYYHDLYQLPSELALERLQRLSELEEEEMPEEEVAPPEGAMPPMGEMPPMAEQIVAAGEASSLPSAPPMPPIGQQIIAAGEESTIG